MPSAANLDWLYHTLGWTLAAAGLGVIFWALFLDPQRKKRRCPKCWYDMSGSPGLQCSECGRTAKSERKLHKSRRRWWAAAPALILLLVGHGAWCVPRFQQEGWTGLVPSTALVVAAPFLPPSTGSLLTSSGFGLPPTPATPPSRFSKQALSNTLASRLTGHQLTNWQVKMFFAGIQRRDNIIRVPPVWPAGVAIPIQLSTEPLLNWEVDLRVTYASTFGAPRLPASTTQGHSARCVLVLESFSGSEPYVLNHHLPTLIRAQGEELLDPIDSPRAGELLRAELTPRVAIIRGTPQIILHDRPDPKSRARLPFIAACILEVRRGDRILATGKHIAPWEVGRAVNWAEAPLFWREEGPQSLLKGDLTLLIRGDSKEAEVEYMFHPFVNPAPTCWTGEFTVPLPSPNAPK